MTVASNNTPSYSSADKTLATALREMRRIRGLGVRELGRKAGVAAPQISRIERGEVKKPTIETLVALSKAFEWNPVPLLILAGYVEADEARTRLAEYFDEGAELIQEWVVYEGGAEELESVRGVLANPETPIERLREVAFDVWLTGETGETLWDDVYNLLPALGEEDKALRYVITAWPSLSFERRDRVVDYVRDQVQLSLRELAAEMRDTSTPEELAAHDELIKNMLAASSEVDTDA